MAKGPSPLLGFNNNVRHRGKIFHIQTEDSGVRHPHVITHLFSDGGRIIKTTKTSYADHLGDEGMAVAVRQLMKEQHKAMFLALRNGLFDDAIEGGESAAPRAERPPVAAPKSAPPPAPEAPPAEVVVSATPQSTPRPDLTTFEPPPSIEPFEPFPLSASLPDYMAPPSAPALQPPAVPLVPQAPSLPQGSPRALPGHVASAPPSARGAAAGPPSARALPRPPPSSRQSPPSSPGRVPPLPAPALPPRPTSFGVTTREVRPPAEARHAEALPPPPPGERKPGAPSLRALHEPLPPPNEAPPAAASAPGAGRAASRSSFPRSTRPPGGRSIFGDDLISEKSLDEVILSYLADDLDGTSNLP